MNELYDASKETEQSQMTTEIQEVQSMDDMINTVNLRKSWHTYAGIEMPFLALISHRTLYGHYSFWTR